MKVRSKKLFQTQNDNLQTEAFLENHIDDGKECLTSEPSFSLLGINIWNGTLNDAAKWLAHHASLKNNITAGFVNANNLNLAYTNSKLSNHYNQECARVFADGSGVKLGAIINKIEVADNVNGTDLLPVLCQELKNRSLSLYLLGATPGTAERVAENLTRRFSGLEIAGTHHGYLNNEIDSQRAINDINDCQPDVLLVAMGTPLQEEWLSLYCSRINANVKLSVGGLFDFFAENVSRAPKFLRQLGCEWVWRLLQEPARMWRRYILGNPLFVYRVFCEKIRSDYARFRKESWLSNVFLKAKNRLLPLRLKMFSAIKRTVDIVASSVLLIALLPLFAIVAAAIKLDSKGSLLFHQERIGLAGKRFKFWKFRSMAIDSEDVLSTLSTKNESKDGVLFKMKYDPRVTRVGKFIRRFSIDELPQLWNVLKGDMSLVGPRPCLVSELEKYRLSDRVRLAVKPGITCLWQIGGRSDLSFEQQMMLDKQYIRERSLFNELKILLLTIPAVLSGKGAY